MTARRTPLLALTVCALVLAGCTDGEPGPAADPGNQPSTQVVGPDEESSPRESPSSPSATDANGPVKVRIVRTVARNLEAPWGVAFLPDGSALVTERDTARVMAVGAGRPREVGRVGITDAQVEGGLLGIAVSPSYDENQRVFLYVTTAADNRVVRTTYDGQRLGPLDPILTGIPKGFIHDGGRLAFGPDGYLYVSTGEIGEGERAQDPDDLGGKILRITEDGEPAPGNPRRRSPVWSLGHRNVQGLAFDDRDRLWASEFGENTWDELNLIDPGVNYGWPLVEGREDQKRFRNPHAQWATSQASPSGLAFAAGSLWMGALRGERLWQVPLVGRGVGRPRAHFVGELGRIRTVVATPQGTLWITTSNRDGRGSPAPEDDRILEVRLSD